MTIKFMNRSELIKTTLHLEACYKTAYDEFIDGLTLRQFTAYKQKNLVPKSLKHQRRYDRYMKLKADWSVYKRRSSMYLVEVA